MQAALFERQLIPMTFGAGGRESAGSTLADTVADLKNQGGDTSRDP